jgi:predicted nuclease of predicted toxin-antitoxin system
MKFLIDENITPDLLALFIEANLNAVHINQFKKDKNQRIQDDQLRRLSLYRNYIIITKDDDFVSSYVHRKVPDKMIFVFNLDQKSLLLNQFSQYIDELPQLLQRYDFLEINQQGIRMPFA